MKKLLQWFSILAILVLLGQNFTTVTAQPKPVYLSSDRIDSSHSQPDFMPPYPGLSEKIAKGEVKLPRSMRDPAYADSIGLDAAGLPQPGLSLAPISGTIRVLAVAVDFSDKVHTVTTSAFDSLLFSAPVSGTGSVRDYYDEISYAQVDIVTVNLPSSLGWQRAPQPYSSYTYGSYCESAYPHNCQKLAEDIVDAINSTVDFSLYDNNGDGYTEPIVIIHSGTGAEFSGSLNDIWSHSWSLYSTRTYDGVKISRYTIQPEYWQSVSAAATDMTIGVIAHEMGHGFWNLPDLYDRENTSEGIGSFDLMASGSWNGYLGSTPAWPSAWTRVQMGFANPTTISDSVTGRSIPQPYDSSAQSILKISASSLGSQEYYLIENRERVFGHYDYSLPAQGLFIWHIDEAMASNQNDYPCSTNPQSSCSDTNHFLVALMQADGMHQLELHTNRGDSGDAYPGSSGNRSFTNTTNPDSGSYYIGGDSGLRVTNISNAAATMTADITLPTANTAPIAEDDQVSIDEDGVLTVNAPGVLANDTDAQGNSLTAIRLTNPTHGILAFNANGAYTYTPVSNWNGIDSFTYKTNDGKLDSNTATVSITVNPINDAPTAMNDTYSFNEDAVLTISSPGVLANDTDIDSSGLTVTLVENTSNGTIHLNTNGSFTYMPNNNYYGPDIFRYKVNDGFLELEHRFRGYYRCSGK